jgi:hypothetical protein
MSSVEEGLDRPEEPGDVGRVRMVEGDALAVVQEARKSGAFHFAGAIQDRIAVLGKGEAELAVARYEVGAFLLERECHPRGEDLGCDSLYGYLWRGVAPNQDHPVQPLAKAVRRGAECDFGREVDVALPLE